MVISKILRTHFTYKLRPEYFINSKFATYKTAIFLFFTTATGRKPKWPLVKYNTFLKFLVNDHIISWMTTYMWSYAHNYGRIIEYIP